MKFRQHVAQAVIRAAVTLVTVSFLIALVFHLWEPGGHYLLDY